MATYFTRYYIEFRDAHPILPATWRVDILDSEGNAPTEPFKLEASANPLVTAHIDTTEDKFTPIIGRQITLGYIYTGNPNEPLPDLFFEATERRFRAIVYKNGVIDGTYYIKPDYSQYPDMMPPFAVELKAVDGLSYAAGTLFNAYDDAGLLFYEKTSLYDALVTRALYQIFDPGTVINVINTLKPVGVSPNDHLLFDNYIHTDIFYDFVSGPLSVKDVITAFCQNFNARLISDKNELWFIRIEDSVQATYNVDRYIDAETVETVAMPDLLRQVGQSTSNDGIPIRISGNFSPRAALKRAEFEVGYKSINQLSNFDWSQWDGSDFADWEQNIPGLSIDRVGSGTIDDPYSMFLSYPQTDGGTLTQILPLGTAELGDIIEFSFRYRFSNVKYFTVRVDILAPDGGTAFTMDNGGEWRKGVGSPITWIQLSRSGRKRDGSFSAKSKPIPTAVEGIVQQTGPFFVKVQFLAIMEGEELEPSELDGVRIYALKLGVIKTTDIGRHITSTNPQEFSRVQEEKKFSFIDTGEDGLSNTIFTGVDMEPQLGGWNSDKAGVDPGDIERKMAQGYINQYQRSVQTWGGTVLSNVMSFVDIVELQHRPGKKFIQLQKTHNNRTAEQDILIAEVFEENSGEFNQELNYNEYDIEEKEND